MILKLFCWDFAIAYFFNSMLRPALNLTYLSAQSFSALGFSWLNLCPARKQNHSWMTTQVNCSIVVAMFKIAFLEKGKHQKQCPLWIQVPFSKFFDRAEGFRFSLLTMCLSSFEILPLLGASRSVFIAHKDKSHFRICGFFNII